MKLLIHLMILTVINSTWVEYEACVGLWDDTNQVEEELRIFNETITTSESFKTWKQVKSQCEGECYSPCCMAIMFNNVGLNHDEQHIMCTKSIETTAIPKPGDVEFGEFFDSDKMFWASKLNLGFNLKVKLTGLTIVCVLFAQSIIF